MNLRGHSAVILASAVVGMGASARLAQAIETPQAAIRVPGDARLGQFSFGYDAILGTSLDLIVHAPHEQDAIECERQVMAEIERLRQILSTYDPTSEISRVKRGASLQSVELEQILHAYREWSFRTDGALSVNMSEVISLWKQAASRNALPTRSALHDALNSPFAWNVDALGKGFIIDRAVEVARRIAPSGLLNIGGDIRAWGDVSWRIGVTDPRNPSDNSPLLTSFDLQNAAAATSGGYARFHTINGRRYSHVIDPRTGWPVDHVTSATIVADDCMTANALSTATTVLGAEPGRILAETFGAAGHAMVDGAQGVRVGGSIPAPARVVDADAAATAWPKDYQVSVELALKDPSGARQGSPGGGQPRRGGGGGKRPYVAVWVEDSNKKVVRTVSVWGNQARWLPELSYWWKAADQTPINVDTISRATRPPGKYTVAWDGKDDRGQPLPPGKYTITVEFNREHGRHVKETAIIECTDTPQKATLKATAESDESSIVYGPRGT